MIIFGKYFWLLVLLIQLPGLSIAQEDLAKQSQNPIGTVISLPFENNLYTDIGPSEAFAYSLNMKPVYPVSLGEWNLINRVILPVIYSQGQDVDVPPGIEIDAGYSGSIEIAKGSAFGLGDTTYQAFFSPAKSSKWVLGIGPAFVLPTATEDRYASNKWSIGVSAIALTMPGKWVVGALVQNVWSVTGDSNANDVNSFLFQYFINYNLSNGWYLSTTPVITANWEADSSNRWTFPIGGGVGKLVKHGKQPVDYKLTAYYNAEKPQFGPDWNIQFQIKLLFPK